MTTLSLFSLLEEGEGHNRVVAPGGPELTPRQREAVERRDGSLFVHAGAGSGKTRVLVERFVRAVAEDGVGVDRMLAITFTEKAADELRARIRRRFLEAGEREHARAVDSAWISTIHGLCARLLRAHALDAGLDPRFRVVPEHEAERLAADAFGGALDDFLAPPEHPRRVELVAGYGPDRLARALRGVHARMRGRGAREPALPQPPGPTATQLRDAHERLAGAVRAAQAALTSEGEPGTRVRVARDRLDRCGDALEHLGAEGALDPHELRDLAIRRGNTRALRGAAFDELEHAHAACLELCARRRALSDLRLLDELLGAYGRRYAQLKTERSALDFDDLELLARDLLLERPALRAEVRARFEHVLVDELQDTDGLQSEILDLVAEGHLFTVGDDLQSIYGFRGAELGVFSARRDAARRTEGEVRLSENFRTRAPILDVLNAAFEPVFGEGFAPLLPAEGEDRVPNRDAPPLVELLAVDRDNARWESALAGVGDPFGAAMRGAPPWRAAEARLLARRIDALLAAGDFEPAGVAVLVRSWSDVNRYEQALAERGVPTYIAGGVGYWSTQQVADLRAYLRALANPRDEEALVSVLGSPLVGASLDALALVGLRVGRGEGLWTALEQAFATERAEPSPEASALADALSADDRRRLSRFVRHLLAERREAPRRSLADLIERATCFSGYDRAVLRLPGGERRMANLRKLKRLAREFEAVEGRDLRGFLAMLDARGVLAAREGEAPLEGEGIDAVRLMTIHAAKGLEFPLVCVGDLGRGDPCDSPLLRVSGDGRVGLRVPDAERGGLEALDARALADEATRAEREEERRLLWVAATRAEERLVVSGALDLERPPQGDGATAMDWLAPALAPDLREAHGAGEWEGQARHVRGAGVGSVAWRALSPASLEALLPAEARAPPERSRTTAIPEPAPAPADLPRPEMLPDRIPLPAAPSPPAGEIARISYSTLESYRRCGYRFYLERWLGLPSDEGPVLGGSAFAEAEPASLSALTRGSVAHELLERLDPRRSTPPPEEEIAARLRARGAAATEQEIEQLRRLVAGFLESPLNARMVRARAVRRELPFAFPLSLESAGARARSVLVEGVMDAHCREGASALVVDYKTDRLRPGDDLEALCEDAYATQRLVYALAALRGGAEEVDVAHVFLERPHAPVLVRYAAAERPQLEERLRAPLAALVAGRYEPSATPGADLCRGCPGRAALCSWPPERTGATLAGGSAQLARDSVRDAA